MRAWTNYLESLAWIEQKPQLTSEAKQKSPITTTEKLQKEEVTEIIRNIKEMEHDSSKTGKCDVCSNNCNSKKQKISKEWVVNSVMFFYPIN
jgi:putative protein kinase ArgK-like GTPase of G3E family